MGTFISNQLNLRVPCQQAIPRWLGILISFLLLTESGFAQDVKNLLFHEMDKTVYTIVEHPPEFPGGRRALENYLISAVRYPAEAKKSGVRDRVIISFIVETDGQLTDVDILKGLGFGCDEEAIRVVQTMPRWIPGSQSGKAVRTKYHFPILFGLDYPKPKGQ